MGCSSRTDVAAGVRRLGSDLWRDSPRFRLPHQGRCRLVGLRSESARSMLFETLAGRAAYSRRKAKKARSVGALPLVGHDGAPIFPERQMRQRIGLLLAGILLQAGAARALTA